MTVPPINKSIAVSPNDYPKDNVTNNLTAKYIVEDHGIEIVQWYPKKIKFIIPIGKKITLIKRFNCFLHR